MYKKPFIAGNWKMHKTATETVETLKELKNLISEIDDRTIMIAPPFTSLRDAFKIVEGSNIFLGGQNMFYEDKGAFTGEISPDMLLDAGCKFVILGHSERRHIFGEGDELINKKIKKALQKRLTPILCVGEKLEEREMGHVEDVVRKQLTGGLKSLTKEDILNIIVAYEPVWAIGTGKTATPEDANSVHMFIKNFLCDTYLVKEEDLIVLYGGSVKPGNIASLMAKHFIDGVLVGGASLSPQDFSKIVKFDKEI